MGDFERQGGCALLLIYYTQRNQFYYLPYDHMRKFWERAQEGGRKSFRYEELEEEFFLHPNGGFLVPYLEGLQRDLERKDASADNG